MNYAQSLHLTATTAWSTWYRCSEVATEYTAATWHWYTQTFFSDAALRRYEEIGRIIGFAMAVAVACGMTARIVAQDWVDRTVAEAQAPAEADPFSPEVNPLPAMPAVIAAPVVVARVTVDEVTDFAAMTSVQLRKECNKAGIAWRNAHGQGRHLKHGEMVRALNG